MIKIAGSVNRSFAFPADLASAFAYYSDMENTLNHLSHISVIDQFSEGQYRMLFNTTELGIYQINIYCDMHVQLDRDAWILRILPFEEVSPVDSEAGMYSLTAQGIFSSESRFSENDNQTQIEYKLNLKASLPVPLGLRFMPASIVNSIARNITHWRIYETAEGFIEHSIQGYQTLQE